MLKTSFLFRTKLQCKLSMSDSEYIKQAEDVFREAIEISRSIDGWKVEKEDKANNLIVEMKKNAHGRKIYRCKVLLLSYLNFIFTPFQSR